MGTPASGEASKGALAALGSDDDARAKIAAALEASGLTGERLREALGAIKKVVLEMRAEGEAFEMSPELEAFLLDELELSERQFELVVTIAARVSGGERRRLRGDIEALLPRLESTFLDHGFGAAQIDVVFEVLPKLVASIRAEKVELELGEAWQRYFERAGLDDDQIAVVVRVARGVAQRMNSKPTRPKRWVTAALKEGGLQPKQIDAVVGLLKKIVRGIAARGEVAKIGPRTHDFLVNRIGLTDAQIARVLAVAVRMADEEKTRRERASLAEHYAKWGIDDAGMERIRAACASRAFEAEQTEAVLRALLRIVPSLLSATDEPAIAPRLHAYLVDEVKLTERQIEFVLGMARRLAVAADPEGRRRRS